MHDRPLRKGPFNVRCFPWIGPGQEAQSWAYLPINPMTQCVNVPPPDERQMAYQTTLAGSNQSKPPDFSSLQASTYFI